LFAHPLLSQTEAQYIASVNAAISGLTAGLGPANHPIIFAGNLVHADGKVIGQANLNNLLAYVDGLKAAGVQRVDINPGLTSINDPAARPLYDAVVGYIRQVGLQLAINPEFTAGELGPNITFQDFTNAAMQNYPAYVARYQPDNFVIVHEPTSASENMGLINTVTVQDWHSFIVAVAPLLKAASPHTRLGAGGFQNGEVPVQSTQESTFWQDFVTIPALDFMTMDIYNSDTFPTYNLWIQLAKTNNKGMYIEEFWAPHDIPNPLPAGVLTAKGYLTEPLDDAAVDGPANPDFAAIDISWVEAMAQYASANGLEAITAFTTQTFFAYGTPGHDKPSDPVYSAAVIGALKSGQITATGQSYLAARSQYGVKPSAGASGASQASPAAGTGAAQTFSFTFSDMGGFQKFTVVDVLINNVLDGRQACYVAFVPSAANSGSLYLVDNAGDAGGPYSGMLLPGNGAVENSQCSISAAGSSVAGSGNTLTLTLAISFTSGFAGNKVLYLAAQDASSISGWQVMGTWNVPGPAITGPGVGGVSPALSSGSSQTYTFTFTDTNGWQDISVANVLINGVISGVGACYVAFVPGGPGSGTVDLVDNEGDAGGPYASMKLPGTGTVSNSQCSISAAGSSVTAGGNTLTLILAIAYSQSFAGTQVLYLAARSNTATSNWQASGLLTLTNATAWLSYARDAQHTALSTNQSQPLKRIHWQTPVDLQPQFSGGELLIHYGSPLVTPQNTVIVPVKTGATGSFRVEAHSGADGHLEWSQTTDYVLPPHDWTPPFGPALTPGSRLYFPGAGGTVYFRDQPDSATGGGGQIAFYGLANYQANSAIYNEAVAISTPITSDPEGNIYFGFLVTGDTPASLQSGIARIGASGQGTWISAAAAASDSEITQVVENCAPAVNLSQGTLYVAVSDGGAGYLVALDPTTLQPQARVRLTDPASGQDAALDDDASSSPTIGPDGDVYYGVLENPPASNHYRGWLLHFNSRLSQVKIPAAFGWDDTASVVPSSMVPSYGGTSSYLLMTKYNDYADTGGTGLNRIAILDPGAIETDPVTRTAVMKEVLTILGPTPDPELGGVKEWCINSAAVDPATKSVLANSEDGKLYRWDLTTNTFTQSVTLTAGLGEAYTPTVIGVDGTVYAINNATLFAVGQ